MADPQNEGAAPSPPDPREGSCSRYCEENQVTTPDPLLVAKMTRLALQMLATDTLRPTVTSAAMELVMDSVSLASPKLRRELMDHHRAALDWVLRDAFTSQVPSGRNLPPESEIVIDGVTGEGMDAAQSYLEGFMRGHQLAPIPLTTADIRQAIEKVTGSMDAELARAWDHGYVCGASDNVADPVDDTYLGISNPYTLEAGDSTP